MLSEQVKTKIQNKSYNTELVLRILYFIPLFRCLCLGPLYSNTIYFMIFYSISHFLFYCIPQMFWCLRITVFFHFSLKKIFKAFFPVCYAIFSFLSFQFLIYFFLDLHFLFFPKRPKPPPPLTTIVFCILYTPAGRLKVLAAMV